MAKDEVLYGYALLDESQHTVSIDDIDRPFTRLHKFYCPHCHNEMYATLGEVQVPHFRHNGEKCQHSKYLHDLAEHVFYEEYTKCLDKGSPFYLELRIPKPCNGACVLKQHVDCKEHYLQKTVDLTKEYTLISLETRVDIDDRYRRPDILLESLDGRQLWVEIWVSHETEEAKRDDARIIEVKIETEKDLEQIRDHKIIQSEGEDQAVRIFGIDANSADPFFLEEDDLPISCYPCEYYYCFEAGKDGFKDEVIDYIKTITDADLTYRIIFRLNWEGRHDTDFGHIGDRVTTNDLYYYCIRRFYSNLDKGKSFLDESYAPLIVSEWKAEIIETEPTPKISQSYRSSYKLNHPAPVVPATTTADISAIEWVDLGLPSGTLWAKEDVDGKMSFGAARKSHGANLPSCTIASELRDRCTRAWDDKTHSIVFTGPNGKSISFPCKESNKSYWLDANEKGDPEFGQCFHIGQDRQFWINDKNAYSAIYVRLISRP